MKGMLKALTVCALFAASQASAQITPDVDFKPPSQLSLNFTFPKALESFKVKFSDPAQANRFSLNFQPVVELVSLLEGKGAKIESKTIQLKEAIVVELKVDGKPIEPIVVECLDCVIVYEY